MSALPFSYVILKDGTVIQPQPDDDPARKIVILGDTSDPSAIAPLAQDASLLVHEATYAFFPLRTLQTGNIGLESVRETAKLRGHSTADMAGKFAKEIKARMLVLNHIGPGRVVLGRSQILLILMTFQIPRPRPKEVTQILDRRRWP